MALRFDEALERRLHQGVALADERHLAAKAAGLDHPLFAELALGETVPGEAVVLFLDIRGYTRLSMGLAPHESARVVDAVLGASIGQSFKQYYRSVITGSAISLTTCRASQRRS